MADKFNYQIVIEQKKLKQIAVILLKGILLQLSQEQDVKKRY